MMAVLTHAVPSTRTRADGEYASDAAFAMASSLVRVHNAECARHHGVDAVSLSECPF